MSSPFIVYIIVYPDFQIKFSIYFLFIFYFFDTHTHTHTLGHVRAYAYPVSGESDEYPCLGTPIAAMKLTPDGLFLIIADESGCIALFELKEKQERIQLNAGSVLPDLITSRNWSDEVLVTRIELEDRAK